MSGQNPSFCLQAAHEVSYEMVCPAIRDEVLVKIVCTGVCGSDVHYLKHGRIGDFVVKESMCLGHESSGIVQDLGHSLAAQSVLKVGQRVALEPGYGCGRCHLCKEGSYNLCEKMLFAATPPSTVGTLTKFFKLPFDMLHPLPDTLTMEDGAMIEPLAVAVHSVHALAKCSPNEVVVVFGAGPVGLLCMAVAKAMGASRVIAVDISPERLAFAKTYAATDTFLPPDVNDYEYAKEMCASMLARLDIPKSGAGGIAVAIEASGASSCQQIALSALRPKGRYVQVGLGASFTSPLPLFQIVNKELSLLGSFRYGPGDYDFAIQLVARGFVNLKPLVTHRYKFDQALQAFETTAAGVGSDGKACLKCLISGPE